MPAAALDVNWEAVRAHAVTHGIRPTAAHFGIAVGTLLARSSREGWLVELREAAKPNPGVLPFSMQPKAVNAISAPDAALVAAQDVKEKSRTGLAKGVLLMSEDAANLAPGTALEHAPLVLAATKAFASLYPEAAAPSTVLNVAFIHQAG